MAPKPSRITIRIRMARERMRRSAAPTLRSTSAEKRARSAASWVKACTVARPLIVSSAVAARSATRSCAERESLRSRRPKRMSGSTTTGTTTRVMAASLAEVMTSIEAAPMASRILRSDCEMAVPTSACSTAISAVRRERMSPVRAVSK